MLLLIGVDGASPEAVERLAAQGRLPTLRALMRHGVYGRLASSPNCSPISAWSSLLTGVNPGKHAAWALSNLVPGSYEYVPPHSRTLRAPALSQLLTERGLEAGTLFVPMTYPAREAEWTTVAGWLCPRSDAEGFAWPSRVADMAQRRMEDVPLDPELAPLVASGRYDGALAAASRGVQAKCHLALDLIRDRRWDMLAVNFVETDRMQRGCWHLIDRSHPSYREDVAARHGDCIEALYAEVDRAVARLSAALEPGDRVMVVSTYGMGIRTGGGTCMPGALELLGLMQHYSPAGGAWHHAGQWLGERLSDLAALARELLPESLARRLPASDTAVDRRGRSERASGIDYEHSALLSAPGGHMVINLTGEMPRGQVSDEAASRYVDQVVRALSAAVDPANGRQPLESVVRREEACSGPFLNRIPHLITRWKPGSYVSGLAITGRDGHVHVVPALHRHMPSGEPTPEGILIAAGGGLRRSARIEGARVEDVTATIMHLCGERIPGYFDGRVLEEALDPAFLAARPVGRLDRDLPSIIDDAERSERFSSIVRDHLLARDYTD